MMLWIILTLLTSGAAVLVATPFLRRFDNSGARLSSETSVYQDQLSEIVREARDGLIDADQADAARVEVERRMLSADRSADRPALGSLDTNSAGHSHLAMIGVTAVVVLGSVGLYAIKGHPDLSSAMVMNTADPVARLAALTQSGAVSEPERSGPPTQLATVDEMIERVIARLRAQPNDVEGWRMLGWSYFSTERYPEAVGAYAKAVALSPGLPLLQSSFGEALVSAANGRVTPQARTVFGAALKHDPKDSRARFFLGVAKEQDGAKAEALDDWLAILADAGADEPWIADLEKRVTELAQNIGTDISKRLGKSRQPATGGILARLEAESTGNSPTVPEHTVPALGTGPTPTDVRNAEMMSPAERTVMIQGMVEGLASRLKLAPRDADGWIKLIRSQMVLGDTPAARIALGQALRAFNDAPSEQGRIAATASELGVLH